MESGYGYGVEVVDGYDEAVIRTRMALRGEGFSILSEMHVGGMLGPAAGEERQYLIMGVWNSVVDQRQLGPDMRAAVHLPCNVVVHEKGPSALVAALDPAEAVDDGSDLSEPVAHAAREALERVLRRVASPA